MFLWSIECYLRHVIFDFYRNSVIHSLLQQPHSDRAAQFTSALRHFSLTLCIGFISAASTTNASEYPDAGQFKIIEGESEIRVLIYRGGLLGGFGHNHTVSTNNIAGRIEIGEDPSATDVELTIPVESFEVDVATVRREEGASFKKEVSDKDKRGTRKNMLGEKLLSAARFPLIVIRTESWSGALPEIAVNAEITVRDQTNILEIPASVSVSGERLTVTGSFKLKHGQIGLKPFKAVLGGLRVRDEMEIKFQIIAKRAKN